MKYLSRRSFFKQGAAGLAALGVSGLVLRSDAAPTEASGELGDFENMLKTLVFTADGSRLFLSLGDDGAVEILDPRNDFQTVATISVNSEEFKSKPFAPHPLFSGFVRAALSHRDAAR